MGKKRFADTFVQKVRESANDNLSSIVVAHLGKPSRSAGGNQFWCCPFHSEKTPSFTITTDKGADNFYHCFGCKETGDAFQFEMAIRNLPDSEFPQVITAMAQKFSIPLENNEASPEQVKREAQARQIVEANAAAAKLFADNLHRQPAAANYVAARRINAESIKSFGIGFASRDLLDHLPKNIRQDTLLEAGLRRANTTDGSLYDFFQSRLMFPISNDKGEVLGFSGRVIAENDKYAKYLNTGETPVFKKGQALFGFFQAKDEIRKTRSAVVVEGNLDVVMLHQAGERRAVAGMGTAFTEHHLRKLLNNADEIYFCFDSDGAGIKATNAAAELFIATMKDGQTAKFLSLPQGEDPDSFVRAGGILAWQEQLKAAKPLSELLAQTVNAGLDTSIPEQKAESIGRAERLIGLITNAKNYQLALRQHLLGTPTPKALPAARSVTDTLPMAAPRKFKDQPGQTILTDPSELTAQFQHIRGLLTRVESNTPTLIGSLYSVPVVGTPTSHPFAQNIKGVGLTLIDDKLFATIAEESQVNLAANTEWYCVADPKKTTLTPRNPVMDKLVSTAHTKNSIGFIHYALERYAQSIIGKRSIAPVIHRELTSRKEKGAPSEFRIFTAMPSLDRPLLLTGSIDDYGQPRYTSVLSTISSISPEHQKAIQLSGAALHTPTGECIPFTHAIADTVSHQQILLTGDEATRIVTSLANNPAYRLAKRAASDLGYEV